MLTRYVRPTSAEDAVANALAQVGTGVYGLAKGAGIWAQSPLDEDGLCDCSHFVCWDLGVAMKNPGRWYLNTDGMVADAFKLAHPGGPIVGFGPQEVFIPVPAGEAPRPGDVVVKQGVWVRVEDPVTKKYRWIRKRPGHTGLIVAVADDFERGNQDDNVWCEDVQVVHCATHRRGRPAIRQSDATAWRWDGFLLRCKLLAA